MYDKSQLMKGTLEGCILQILSETVTYGYEIVTTLTEFGFEDVKEGSIYPLLVRLEKKGMISSELRPSPLAISIGIWYLGHYGEANCNNTEKTKQLTAGIVIYMGVDLLIYCNEIIIAIDNGKAFLKTSDFPILIIGIIVNFGPAILYLVGARRNRPAGEQIEVESR